MSSFIAALKSRLAEADWPVVVASLRSEAQAWAELQGEFGVQALDAAGAERARWSPAFLGLLKLGHAQQFETLRATPMQAVSEKLRYEAAAVYEQLASEGFDAERALPDLTQATLLALALRERRRLLNGWEQLADDLSIATAEFWKLPVAVLFGLLPKQHELLVELLDQNKDGSLHQLGLHALVSNPLTLDVQSSHLLEIVQTFQLPQFLNLLRVLSGINAPLARQAAMQALENLDSEDGEQEGLGRIQRLLLQAEIYQISGQAEQAVPLLNSAWEASQRLQNELAAKVAETNGDDEAEVAALQESAELADPKHVGAVKVANKRPSALFTAAKVAWKAGDMNEARMMAVAALQAAAKEQRVEESQHKAALLKDLGDLFIELHLPQEAEVAAKAALALQANDSETAALLSHVLMANGKPEQALDHAHLAAALAPERNDLRRSLAQALQQAGEVNAAFDEWQAVLSREEQPSVEDLLAFAAVALNTEHIEDAIRACQETLALHPTNGAAYTILGHSLQAQGDESSAIQYLRRATELAPAQAGAWLSLAQLLMKKEGAQAAADVLTAAQGFIAPSARQQALLAECYVQLGRSDEAEPVFQRAAQLAAEQADGETAQTVALSLSRLQLAQGANEAALRTLDASQVAFPANAEIAALFGKMLLAAGEPKRALAALAVAHQAQPENGTVLVDLARAQLAVNGEDAEAERSLRAALSLAEVPAEAQAMLAGALAAQGKHSEAIGEYDAALKATSARDAATRKSLILGKAASQAASGKPVAALQSLENLDKQQPGDLDVLRALCAAYKLAGRSDEAAEIASKVYSANTGNEATLLWYAEQMHALGKSAEACRVLGNNGAKGLNMNAPLALSLGKLQWHGESKQAAISTFGNLAKMDDAEAVANAAMFLLEHNAANESLPYFKRALELSGPQPDLLDALTDAHIQVQDWPAALDAVDQSISLAPHKPQSFEVRAEILQRMGRPQAAVGSLEKAIEMLPGDASLQARKAKLLRENGDWSAALAAAGKAFEFDASHPGHLQAAAELAAVTLQDDKARSFFVRATVAGTSGLELACLQAELALQAGEEVQAAKAVAVASSIDGNHARVLALQSQLAACRGDRGEAELLLQQAGEVQQHSDSRDVFTLLSIASGAERLNDWQTALDLYAGLAKAQPGMPLVQFSFGRALVLRTEWQQLCERSKATQGLPGAAALGKEARKLAQQAFAAAAAASDDGPTLSMIAGWALRGELAFGAKVDVDALPAAYPANAGEAAALYAVGNGDKAIGKRVRAFINAPELMVLRAMQEGIEASEAAELTAAAAKAMALNAPIQALAAFAAQAAGQTEQAVEFVQRALALWSTQPSWQALAGELQTSVGNLTEATQHYSQASALEPDQAKHYYALGTLQVAERNIQSGIASLQKAVDAQPKQVDYLLALANAQRAAGNLGEAKARAQQAHKAAPKDVSALVLQAELALQDNDAAAAKGLIEQALALAPQAADALRIFAEVLQALGNNEDAIAVLERAAEAAEDQIPLLIRRAQLLPDALGLDALIKLSRRYTDRAEVFFALSDMLAKAGNLQDAISAAQRAVKLAGETGAELLAQMHQHVGQLLKQAGNLDQSLHHLEEAIRLAPYLLQAHIERGRVFLARRQQNKALEAFRQAAASAPKDAAPHYEAALALKEAKNYDAAERELRAAAKLSPKDRNIQRQLAAVIALNIVHHRQEAGVEQ